MRFFAPGVDPVPDDGSTIPFRRYWSAIKREKGRAWGNEAALFQHMVPGIEENLTSEVTNGVIGGSKREGRRKDGFNEVVVNRGHGMGDGRQESAEAPLYLVTVGIALTQQICASNPAEATRSPVTEGYQSNLEKICKQVIYELASKRQLRAFKYKEQLRVMNGRCRQRGRCCYGTLVSQRPFANRRCYL